jgi:ATP-dependent RNA helicase RhlE
MTGSFSDLNLSAQLLNALDELGYTRPTSIQQKAFSVIMSGRDVCGIAQTGTGKTFAYLLPLLRLYKYSRERNTQVLILVPTRELVIQVEEAVKDLAKYISLKVVGVFGGVNMKPQAAAIENGAEIVVGTPGRVLDLAYNGNLKLKYVKKLVIDEMDEMLNLGFRTQLNNILDMLPERRQNLLFSATITEEVELLLTAYFNDPERIEAAPAGTPLENIRQVVYEVPNFYTKVNLLKLLLHEHPEMNKVLVFVATKKLADDLFEQLQAEFEDQAGIIHSNKEQNYRFNTVRRFADGTYRFIIATDIIARGLDISGVSHVINFDMPDLAEHYIHRIGRTGRADEKGEAISFVTEREAESREAVEALMKYTIPVAELPANLEISTELTADEMPKVHMRDALIKLPDLYEGGGAFHEKLDKNKKINKKVRHADKMREKYGKPKTRGAKKKKR